MRARKLLGGTVAVSVLAVAVALIRTPHTVPHPPVVNLVSVEPFEIVDDTGAEMFLATLSISNPDNPAGPENCIYVRGEGKGIEAKVANRWIGVNANLDCRLDPGGGKHEIVFAVPAATDSCRLSFRYTGSRPSFARRPLKARLEWFAERLPKSIRFRLSYEVWRWLGFGPDYRPSSDWRGISVEVPFRRPSVRPTAAPVQVHERTDRTSALDARTELSLHVGGCWPFGALDGPSPARRERRGETVEATAGADLIFFACGGGSH